MPCGCKSGQNAQTTKVKQVVKRVRRATTSNSRQTDSNKRASVRQIRYRRPL